MKLLGIETSTRTGSVAIVEGEEIIAEYTLKSKETHTARLMPAIDHILKDTHLTIHQMDAVAVSLGPGSFTGLRIGLATAKGLCLALRKPLVGILTLDALAHNICYSSHIICPLLDARKGEVYAALYRHQTTPGTSSAASSLTCKGNLGRPASEKSSAFPSPVTGYQLEKLTDNLVLPPDELLSKIDDSTIFLGDTLARYRSLIEKRLGNKAAFAPPYLNFPRAANVAILGLRKLKAGGETDLQKIKPLYVRRPEAEVKWEEKHPK